MKKLKDRTWIATRFIVVIIIYGLSFMGNAHGGVSAIVTNTSGDGDAFDSVTVSFIVTDSVGNMGQADSFIVVIFNPVGDSVYAASYIASSTAIDSIKIGSRIVYRWTEQIATIDAAGRKGTYTGVLIAVDTLTGAGAEYLDEGCFFSFIIEPDEEVIQSDIYAWNGTAVAAPATAGYPAVTIKSGVGTGEISLSGGKTLLQSTQTFSNTGTWTGSLTGSVGSVTGAVGSVTGSVGSVTGAVGSVTGAVGSVTGNVGGSVGSVTGAVGSVTGNVGGNVVGSVASVTANVNANLVQVQGKAFDTAAYHADSARMITSPDMDNMVGTISDAEIADITVGSVTGAVGSVTGSVGSVTGNVGGNVVGSVGSVTGAVGSVTGSVGSVTGAVGSVSGNVGGNVVGSVGSLTTNNDKTGYSLAATEWEEVWRDIDTTNIDTSLIGKWLSTGIAASISNASMGAIADSVWKKDSAGYGGTATMGGVVIAPYDSIRVHAPHGDDWSGGSGTGNWPCSLWVVADGSTPIMGAKIRIYDLDAPASQAGLINSTNSDGRGIIDLGSTDPDSFLAAVWLSGYTTDTLRDTIVVSSTGGHDTLNVTTISLTLPDSAGLCRVHGIVATSFGQVVEGARVIISPQQSLAAKSGNKILVPTSKLAETDANGIFEMYLERSTNVVYPKSDSTYRYTMKILVPDEDAESGWKEVKVLDDKNTFTVPDSNAYSVEAILSPPE